MMRLRDLPKVLLVLVVITCLAVPLTIGHGGIGQWLHPKGNPIVHRYSDVIDQRAATIVVAASNSENRFDVPPKYRCSGSDDDVTIQSAIDALSSGGSVWLMDGSYDFSSTLTHGGIQGITIVGSGRGTIIDSSNLASGNLIEMGQNWTISSLKIVGTISPLPIAGSRAILANNNTLLSDLYIENTGTGINTDNCTNVKIRNYVARDIRDAVGGGAALHGAGTVNGVYATGIDIAGCNRGIEFEDGASNIFCSKGRIVDLVEGPTVLKMSLDAHSHDGYGGVDNIVYRDFYIEGSPAPECYHAGNGWSDDDMPRNVIYDGITVISPTGKVRLNGHNVQFLNSKIDGTTLNSSYCIDFGRNSRDVLVSNLEITETGGAEFFGPSHSDVARVTVENSVFNTTASPSYLARFDNYVDDVRIYNCDFSGSGSTAAMNVRAEGADIRGNRFDDGQKIIVRGECEGLIRVIDNDAEVQFDYEGSAEVSNNRWPITLNHTSYLFNNPGLTDGGTLWTQPARTTLVSVMIQMDEQFVATNMTDLRVTIGLAGDNDGILQTTGNLTSDAANTEYKNRGAYWNAATGGEYYCNSATEWKIYSTATGANLDTTTAGQITIWLRWERMI